jgi:hypothetical protein
MIPITVGLWGGVATLKSSCARTFPGKIAWHSFDIGGFERARGGDADKFILYEYPAPVRLSMGKKRHQLDGWVTLWTSFLENLSNDLKNPDVHTVVYDTMTRMWLACHRAYLEDAQSRNPNKEGLVQIEYGEINPWMFEAIDAVKTYKKNLVMTAHDEEQREDVVIVDDKGRTTKESVVIMDKGKPVMKMQGFRHAWKNADLVLQMVADDSPVGIVTKAGIGSESIKNMKIPYPTYQKIEAMVAACEVVEAKGMIIPGEFGDLIALAEMSRQVLV